MAGHSKWANIKHAKAKMDAKRGKIFTKLIRAITIAARTGGADPSSNAALRLAMDKALDANMPKDTIQRAIKRGAGLEEGSQLFEVRYEGYGPHGVAIMVECLTDNKNRTVGEVRHAFTKCNGNLGTDGSVAYLFNKKGVITFAPLIKQDAKIEEKITDLALNYNAEDIHIHEDGSIDIITDPEHFTTLSEALRAASLNPVSAELTMVPTLTIKLDTEQAEQMLRLVEMLEDLDDVQVVHSNAE